MIVETTIDKATGKRLHVLKLDSPDLLFDNPTECQSILDKMPPVVSAFVTVVQKCVRVHDRTLN